MRSYLRLFSVGLGLLAVVTLFGGWSAGAGGMVAIGAQLVALALIRPAFSTPHPVFVRRWLAGMGIRAAAVIGLVVYAALHRSVIAPLPAALGCLGVLLPLLFTETRFLK